MNSNNSKGNKKNRDKKTDSKSSKTFVDGGKKKNKKGDRGADEEEKEAGDQELGLNTRYASVPNSSGLFIDSKA